MDAVNTSYLDTLNLGDHLYCIYRTNEEMYSLIIPFFINGLKKGNKCLFILGDESEDEIIRTFKEHGFDLSKYILKKDFEFKSHKEIYLKDNVFNIAVITTSLKNAESEALRQGYSALRVAGSTSSWAIEETPIISELEKYESVVNEFIESSYIIAACLYKESSFKHETLANMFLHHPYVYLYGKLVKNKYYTPPYLPDDNQNEKISYEEMTKSLYQ